MIRPGNWLPSGYIQWAAAVDTLFWIFLRYFDQEDLERILEDQRGLTPRATPAERMALLALDLTALHKLCQIIARHPSLPPDARATLAPLERLPPTAIPEEATFQAIELARQAWPELQPDPLNPKVGRGSVADVFRFDQPGNRTSIALKKARPDALPRIRREADILMRMAGESVMIEAIAGLEFARTVAEAMRDAARGLLREIDFEGEATNLRDAAAFYRLNDRIRIPAVKGPPLEEGVFMEFIHSAPILEFPWTEDESRRTARIVFRALLLEPLFSGQAESIFHADPHAGNILARRDRYGNAILVLLDWSQAGRLSARLRHALVDLCLHCFVGKLPSPELLGQIIGQGAAIEKTPIPRGADPLHQAFSVVEQLAAAGYPVPANLLLLRKSFLTLEGVTHEIDPGFDAWREMQIYAAWVFASETPFRVLTMSFPWLDRAEFFRSGIPTRTLATRAFEAATHFVTESWLAHPPLAG